MLYLISLKTPYGQLTIEVDSVSIINDDNKHVIEFTYDKENKDTSLQRTNERSIIDSCASKLDDKYWFDVLCTKYSVEVYSLDDMNVMHVTIHIK